MKRAVYRLRWDASRETWCLYRRGHEAISVDFRKDIAERWARRFCQRQWEACGTPCQLLIYRKNGKIGRGGRSEASYGCDSRRRKG